MSIETAIERLANAFEKLGVAVERFANIQNESNVISSKLIPINSEFISKLEKAVDSLPKETAPAPPVEPGPKPGPDKTVVEDPKPTPTPESTAGPDEFDDFEPGPDAGPTETVKEKVDPPKPGECLALLRRIASEIGNADAKNILAEFGAKKFSEVPVDQYADFHTLASKILGGA